MGDADGNGNAGRGRIRRALASFAKYILPGLVTAAILAAVGLGYRSLTRDEEKLHNEWWPERPITYRCDAEHQCLGADHVVFNSIVNLPSYGDERAFVDVRPSGASLSASVNVLEVVPGDEVIARAYIDNNANPHRSGVNQGVALATRMRFAIPDAAADEQLLRALLSARNAKPEMVGDTALLIGDEPFSLSYVEGTARLYNSVFDSGFPLSSSIISDGAKLGVEEAGGHFCCRLNGHYPPCDPVERGCQVFESVVELKLAVSDPNQASGITRRGGAD